jgi:hypothetical protein
MSERDHEWTPDERAALRSLRSAAEPPAELEDQVVRALRAGGELDDARRRPLPRVTQAAALAAAMVAGALLGRATAGTTPPPVASPPAEAALAAGPTWLLLLRAAPTQDGTPEATLVAEYTRWYDDLARDGRVVLAAALEDSVRLVGPEGERSEGSGLGDVQGFFILTGDDADGAVTAAAESPHVGHGGLVEVRAVRR